MAQVRRTVTWMAAGAGCGLTWGIAIRAWMRVISDEPEFSLSGTLFIVGAATIVGLGFGLGLAARTWRTRVRPIARWLGGLTVVFLGIGAGSITLPTIVFGGIALGNPRTRLATRIVMAVGALAIGGLAGSQGAIPWVVIPLAFAVVAGVLHPTTTRATLTVLAIAPIVMVAQIVLDADLPLWRRLLGVLAYPAVMAPITLAFSRIVTPLLPIATAPETAERTVQSGEPLAMEAAPPAP